MKNLVITIIALMVTVPVQASELTWGFKSPAFHYGKYPYMGSRSHGWFYHINNRRRRRNYHHNYHTRLWGVQFLMRNSFFIVLAACAVASLSGCAATGSLKSLEDLKKSPVVSTSPIDSRLAAVPPIEGPKISIAVYAFADKTGQRKAGGQSSLSSAVTQGAEAWVIKALQDVGKGDWFNVVERVGMDNLIKERQLIRQTREVYEKEAPNGPIQLKPLIFAGLLLEGGIIGYDSDTAAGGVGARFLGVGASTEYRIDTVTVVMRLVSVQSGKVLMSIATEKSVASYRSSADVFKFIDLGRENVEIENGYSVNEPINYAVRAAIEQGIIEMIYQGDDKKLWKIKK
jgi:curli production assembly/transport component CsgG